MGETTQTTIESAPDGFKQTQIGLIPEEWEVASFASFADCRGGYTFPPEFQGQTHGEIPFFKVSDMNLPTNSRVMLQANNYVSRDLAKALRARSFLKGAVIFPKIGAAIHTNKKRILTTESL